MTGSDVAIQYYYINPESGLITVKKLLTEGDQVQDEVRRC